MNKDFTMKIVPFSLIEAISIIEKYRDKVKMSALLTDTAALPTKEQAQMKMELVAFNTALDALNRLNPKRPTQADSHVKALDVENNKVVTFRCSRCVCGKYIVQNANNKFCQHCGQALDWGDSV